jgi:nicotinamide-nucleotide amidase
MLNEIDMSLAQALAARLLAQHWLIGAAESCTGGLFLSSLTDMAGSSAYVQGGFVTYSNWAKQHFVGVPEALLNQYGAVSEPVARAMAQGAQQALAVQVALGITGIAGPGGATPDKPVGLVYIACATAQSVQVERYIWQFDRRGNKIASVNAALALALACMPPE